MEESLRALDLNLLRVFDALRVEGSVSAAARSLGITQSGASRALARLRDALGDLLFVTTASGLVLTPYAAHLAEHIRGALDLLGAGLARAPFAPALSDRRFALAVADWSEALLLPPLFRRLELEAPQVGVELVALPREPALAGGLDLRVDPIALEGPGLIARKLLRDRHVWVARIDHPVFDGATDRPAREVIPIRPQTFVATILLLTQTDWITTMPRLLANQLVARGILRVVPRPVAPERFELTMHWHERNQGDAGHRWFRTLVRDVAATLERGVASAAADDELISA